jgi:DNA-binding winged helix-turn-helix (wHTH) protein
LKNELYQSMLEVSPIAALRLLEDLNMPSALHFGIFEWRPMERQLLRQGVPVKLGSRSLDLLNTFVAHHQRTVSPDKLLDVVWGGKAVESSNLTTNISKLRKLLGGTAIVAGRGGYVFTMPITKVQPSGFTPLEPE